MVKILKLCREGEIEEIEFDNCNLESKAKDINYEYILGSNYTDVIELNDYYQNNNCIKVFGSENSFIFRENKHELFYPLNQKIYYGDILLIKINDMENIIDFSIIDMKKYYE